MGKKLTLEEKAARDQCRAEQVEKAKGKKHVKNLTVAVWSKDRTRLEIVATENDGLRTNADVAEWMEKTGRVGSVYPFRLNQPITRYEQKKFRTIIGEVEAQAAAPEAKKEE